MFQARQEKLDWQLIADIEPQVVILGAPEEMEKVQRIMPSIAHCNLETEFSKEMLENTRGLAKLFKLSQIIIQHLLHCQDTLKADLLNMEKIKDSYGILEKETIMLRKEVKKSRKLLAVQQESLFKGTDIKEFQKCLLCSKTFINESFLVSHMNRRHKSDMKQDEMTKRVLSEYLSHSKQPSALDNNSHVSSDELMSLLQDIRKELNTSHHGQDFNKISSIINNQQSQIDDLQKQLQQKEGSMNFEKMNEDHQGRLKAQELFWQSKVKDLEENFKTIIHDTTLKQEEFQENIQEEVTLFKKKLRKEKRRERKRKAQSKDVFCQDVNEVTIFQSDERQKEKIDKERQMTNEVKEEKEQLDVMQPQDQIQIEAEAQKEIQRDEKIESEEIFDLESEDDEEEEPVNMKPAVSAISLKSDHVYEAPLSYHTSKESVIEMFEKNPSKLDELREKAEESLADSLSKVGVHSSVVRINKRQLNEAMKRVKERRKSLSNSTEISTLRKQCAEEVESIAMQSAMKSSSFKRRIGKGMSSFRKQIFRSLQNLAPDSNKAEVEAKSSSLKKRSPKKNCAPQPPKLVKQATVASKENEYVISPAKLPPKPAPRLLKEKVDIRVVDSDSEDEEHEKTVEPNDDDNEFDIVGYFVDKDNMSIQKSLKASDQGSDTENDIDNLSDDDSVSKKDEIDEDEKTVVDEDLEENSLWDSEDEHIEEIEENVEIHHQPEEIKLRKPEPGSKIADLTNIIEQQLHRRSSLTRPAGGVDPLLAAMEEIDKNLNDDTGAGAGVYHSMTDLSSNTMGTSQWQDNGSYHTPTLISRPGSGATLASSRPGSALWDSSRPNPPSSQPLLRSATDHSPVAPPRRRRTSWDSD